MQGRQGCCSFYLLAILKKKRGIALAKRFLVQPEKIVNSEISKPDYIIAQIYKKALDCLAWGSSDIALFSRTLGTNRRRQSFAFYDNISKVFLAIFDNYSKLLNKPRFRRADAVRASSCKFAQVRAIISPAYAGLILIRLHCPQSRLLLSQLRFSGLLPQ